MSLGTHCDAVFAIGMVKNTWDNAPWHCCQRAVVTKGDRTSE
jgi:hypothetical protein